MSIQIMYANNNIITCTIYNNSHSNVINSISDNVIYDINKGFIKAIYNGEEFTFNLTLKEKQIKFISNNKKFIAKIICYEEIIFICEQLNIKNNPHVYLKNNDYFPVSIENFSKIIVNEIDYIKNLEISQIKIKDLEEIYNKRNKNNKQCIKKKIEINKINPNLNIYYPDILKNETIYFTLNRIKLFSDINHFIEDTDEYNHIFEDKRKKILFPFYGNYASGKSLTLIILNNQKNSIYINFKCLNKNFGTTIFWDLIFSEIMNIYINENKTFEEYIDCIKSIHQSNYNKKSVLEIISNLIIEVHKKRNNNLTIIFLDQYKNNNDNMKKLKKLINQIVEEDLNIKIIMCSSQNDKYFRNIYYQETFYNEKNKDEYLIPFRFYDRIISKEEMKDNIIEHMNEYNYLSFSFEKFEYLPLYINLCIINKNNLGNFIENTKKKIKSKIEEFFNNNEIKNNILEFEEIRQNIDIELSDEKAKQLSKYIPFKYFYFIHNQNNKKIIKYYFPLIKEVWESLILEKSFILFNGDTTTMTGKVIGSIFELNLISYLTKNKENFDIDIIIMVDTIKDMNKIIKSETNQYYNKNIFFIQNNENGPDYDCGYLMGKNVKIVKFCYIQIKKAFSSNLVNKYSCARNFIKTKENFKKHFNLIPEEIYLTYIGLINNYFINLNLKKPKSNELDKINKLFNFCEKQEISIIYYSPSDKLFYKKINNTYVLSKFELFENKNKMHLDSSNVDFNKFFKINKKHYEKETLDNYNFLNKKRELNENYEFKYENYSISNLEIKEFLDKYINNPKILSYIEVIDDNIIIPNIEEDNNILIGLVVNKNKLSIKYLIYKDKIYDIINSKFSKTEDVKIYIYVFGTSLKYKLKQLFDLNN